MDSASLTKRARKMKSFILVGCLITAGTAILLYSGCTIGMPLRGPGLEAAGSPERVIVAVTHAKLHWTKRAAFDRHIQIVADALPRFPGLVGYSLRKQIFGDEAWTMSIWASHEAMQAFVRSPVHRAAVAAGRPAIKSMRYRAVEVASSELPIGWTRAVALLETPKVDYAVVSR